MTQEAADALGLDEPTLADLQPQVRCSHATSTSVLSTLMAAADSATVVKSLSRSAPQVEYYGEYQLTQNEEPEPLAMLTSARLAARRFENQLFDLQSDASTTAVADIGLGVAQWSIPPEELSLEGEPIGRGSIGEVFLGSWRGMRVAIKRIYRKDYPPALLLALSAEVSVLFQLRHPNLLLFLGASIGPDTFCIVSEYMDRGPLRPILLDPHQRCVLKERLRNAIRRACQAMLT